ncbi:MAG: nuclear transport factor 2 family protein [Solirubrobacterales bacterium]|nr:nuclear transport factor 2 family protein [Solirubrobacterales bacterium]
MSEQERAVRAFVEAFNEQQLERLASLLDPAAEIQTRRGVAIGREEAKAWARSNPDGALVQRLELDTVSERGNHVLVDLRRQWHWREPPDGGENGEPADESPLSLVATFRDGLICRWQPFEDRDRALALLAATTAAR